ncbi:DgyrCDS5115 [Dimorphilus gyrociliatus]|uniref:DgyrCDS5115 n=1 Tax=Dimorphilus gyrociliatus TaxID=2664684 RepID=A0A7I8VL80_9ANNE|nr:DgyrCDS5115 [Dimorphilus gyrociliatus]
MADDEKTETAKDQINEEAPANIQTDNNSKEPETGGNAETEQTENVENKSQTPVEAKEATETKDETSAGDKAEEQVEEKPDDKADDKSEVKPEDKPDDRADGENESKDDTEKKTEDNSEIKSEEKEKEKADEPDGHNEEDGEVEKVGKEGIDENVEGEKEAEKEGDGGDGDGKEGEGEVKTADADEEEKEGDKTVKEEQSVKDVIDGDKNVDGTETEEKGEEKAEAEGGEVTEDNKEKTEKEGEENDQKDEEGEKETSDNVKDELTETKKPETIEEESKEEELERDHEVDPDDEELRTATRLSDPRPKSESPRSPPNIASPTDFEESDGAEELEELNQLEQEEYENKTRENLYKEYLELLEQRNELTQKNSQYQNKIYDYFRRKKMDEGLRTEVDKAADNEQKYLKYMKTLSEFKQQYTNEELITSEHLSELKERCQYKQKQVSDIYEEFLQYKKEVALKSISTRSSKNISEKEIDAALLKEMKKEEEVSQVRLENHKLKHKLQNKEQQLKSKEELAEGLHLIDFEQLKIENQTYNEKIEERNEELVKLRKKITSTVQVLTHLKEKLQHLQAENSVKDATLREVEQKAAKKRDLLSRTKQVRDALRNENLKLRQNCGLLGNEILLRDFEERVDEGNALKNRLEELKIQHAQLTLQANGIKQKIELAKGNLQGVQKFM